MFDEKLLYAFLLLTLFKIIKIQELNQIIYIISDIISQHMCLFKRLFGKQFNCTKFDYKKVLVI